MKKYWWLFILLIIIIAGALIYILIPANITVSKYVYIKCQSPGAIRYLHDEDKWRQWFTGRVDSEHKFVYDNNIYKLGKKSYASINVTIISNENKYESQINIIPISTDSSAVQWQFNFAASNNPAERIRQYKIAKHLHNNITVLLNNFKNSVASIKNIYGFDIKFTTLTDTALVSTKTSLKQYPSTQIIYKMIGELQQYIKQQHAIQHNYPMLNITRKEDSSYEVKVGIPTNIPLPGNNTIEPKRMIMMKDKTLITEVVGDNSTIQKAFKAINNYMDDNKLSSPVIPFQQLVTDRSKQPDSTKWVTRIFTPII